jgi:hypothetical protein
MVTDTHLKCQIVIGIASVAKGRVPTIIKEDGALQIDPAIIRNQKIDYLAFLRVASS